MQTDQESEQLHLHLLVLHAQGNLLRVRQLPSAIERIAGLLLSARRRTNLRPLVRALRPAGDRRQDRMKRQGSANQ